MKTWSCVGPHFSRKHVILADYPFGGSAAPPAADAAELAAWAEAWKTTWDNVKREDSDAMAPDGGGYMQHWPEDATASSMSASAGGIPAIMLSCWACLCRDVLGRWPDAIDWALSHKAELRRALDVLLERHGDARPPCPRMLFKEARGGGDDD